MPTLDTRTPPLAQASPHVHSVVSLKIDALAPSSDYFTQAVSRLASQANIAGGRLVHGADGRPAGLYFQPRESSASQNSKAGSINPASDARRPHIQTRRSDKTGRSTSTPAPPTPSYPTASMLRAAQSHLPSVKGSASAVHVPQLPRPSRSVSATACHAQMHPLRFSCHLGTLIQRPSRHDRHLLRIYRAAQSALQLSRRKV